MTSRELRAHLDLAHTAFSHAWEFDMPLPRGETLDGLLGIRITERRAGRVAGRLPVRDAIRQPDGSVHGGTYAALAEALAFVGTLDAVADGGRTAVELSNTTSFIGPVNDGAVYALAQARHVCASTWIWDVELCDDEGRICAISRVTFAVRDGDTPSGRSRPGFERNGNDGRT